MEKLTQAEKIAEAKIEEAVGSRYPARALHALEKDERWIGGGEAERILIERWEGVMNYALELESLLLDTDRQLHETRDKLRSAELMVAMKNIGRAA